MKVAEFETQSQPLLTDVARQLGSWYGSKSRVTKQGYKCEERSFQGAVGEQSETMAGAE